MEVDAGPETDEDVLEVGEEGGVAVGGDVVEEEGDGLVDGELVCGLFETGEFEDGDVAEEDGEGEVTFGGAFAEEDVEVVAP